MTNVLSDAAKRHSQTNLILSLSKDIGGLMVFDR